MSKKTRQVQVGSVRIGGGAPVSVQSMTNTDTADVEKTLSQIRALTVAGADIVRVSVTMRPAPTRCARWWTAARSAGRRHPF
ncbi:MAG: flavodoxin-dependent (E)-4-hydroxy-3-methylbut-2-enyl-diphosphate synthase [Christensenellales bacterium]